MTASSSPRSDSTGAHRPRLLRTEGQALVEFALVTPLVLTLVLGVVEISYGLLDQHVVTKLAREGSNLISRDASLTDAATAMRNMSTRPVDFVNAPANSKLIFSVIKRGATTGSTNYNKDILYQRYEYGGLSVSSKLTTAGSLGSGTFPAPDYIAVNSDSNASLRLTNLPAGLLVNPGGLIYVTEVYSKHTLITPFDHFGVTVPDTLYSIAYF